jgi:hypothetical protein
VTGLKQVQAQIEDRHRQEIERCKEEMKDLKLKKDNDRVDIKDKQDKEREEYIEKEKQAITETFNKKLKANE